jgi:hypothetical protein
MSPAFCRDALKTERDCGQQADGDDDQQIREVHSRHVETSS